MARASRTHNNQRCRPRMARRRERQSPRRARRRLCSTSVPFTESIYSSSVSGRVQKMGFLVQGQLIDRNGR